MAGNSNEVDCNQYSATGSKFGDNTLSKVCPTIAKNVPKTSANMPFYVVLISLILFIGAGYITYCVYKDKEIIPKKFWLKK